jgi:hypothetical protein
MVVGEPVYKFLATAIKPRQNRYVPPQIFANQDPGRWPSQVSPNARLKSFA